MASEDQEYITEWPPPLHTEPFTSEGEEPAAPKKQRITEEEGNSEATGGDKTFRDLVASPPSIKAEALLARWRKERAKNKDKSSFIASTDSKNPKTILFGLSRTSEARAFLHQRVKFLLSLRAESASHAVYFSLATCYHMLSDSTAALQHAEEAKETCTELTEDVKEVTWLLELLNRQRVAEERKKEGMSTIEKWPPGKLRMPQYTEVERRTCSGLSCAEFYTQYVQTHTPVIITGIVDKMTSKPWTLDYVKKVIGHKKAPLKKVVHGSVEWAQLEEAHDCEVKKFIESLESQDEDLTYLFDWSLPLNCPELMAQVTIPDYFADNYLVQTPKGTLYHDSWPSLFIAPAAITSGLHVDAFSSNFWMALFEGKKRWVFFPPEDLPFLYPIYYHSTDAIFEVDLSQKDAALHHPLLALTGPRECVLGAGELLFVPNGSPHRVENLEKSLAISANFVNRSNIDAVKSELRVNGLLDPRAENLFSILEDMNLE